MGAVFPENNGQNICLQVMSVIIASKKSFPQESSFLVCLTENRYLFFVTVSVAAHKLVHTTCGIHQFGFTGIEWV